MDDEQTLAYAMENLKRPNLNPGKSVNDQENFMFYCYVKLKTDEGS